MGNKRAEDITDAAARREESESTEDRRVEAPSTTQGPKRRKQPKEPMTKNECLRTCQK